MTTVVGTRSAPPPVWPGPPTCALNDGEKSSSSQFVVVKLAVPVAVLPVWGTAVKFVVLLPHDVGLRMNGWPVPGAVPNRVMSCELIVVSRPEVEFGMSLITVFRPKSGLSWTADWRMTLGTTGGRASQSACGSGGQRRLLTGRRTIPKRAGSPGCGVRL